MVAAFRAKIDGMKSTISAAPANSARRGRRPGRLLPLFLLFFVPAGPAGGYELLGIKWPQKRASFAINPNFSASTGTPSHQIEVLECAAATWRNQSEADYRFDSLGSTTKKTIDDQDGVNVLFFTPDDGNDALAATFVTGLGQRFTGFDLVFYGRTGNIINDWQGSGEPQFGRVDLWGVATHELGHALGLDHTKVQGATMVAFIVDRALPFRTLHDDDIAGVEFLYGKRAGAVVLPQITSITPDDGPEAGGGEVLILGSNFTWEHDTQLFFGSKPVDADQLLVESCSRLRVAGVPPNAPGSVDVKLTNEIGTFTFTNGFLYLGEARQFTRGDVNDDDLFDISDPVTLLLYLFAGRQAPACLDSADANDDGSIGVGDAIFLLLFLFQHGEAPSAPFPSSGGDPTPDPITCS
jgi:predicted Zn-dependent protease